MPNFITFPNQYIMALVLLLIASVSIFLLKARQRTHQAQFWADIPSVGIQGDTWFAWPRGILRSITNSGRNALQGYRKHCKRDRPFVVPSAGCGALVILPPSQLSVLNKSESKVLALPTQMESHQPRYTMGDQAAYADMIHFDIVRNQLTRQVGFFTDMTQDELIVAFQDCVGAGSNEWMTVNLWDLCTKVIARAGNRAYVGLPLCRDKLLLEQTRLYATAVYGSASFINALPPYMRPIFGPVIGFPAQRYLARCKKILVPFVKERLDMLSNDEKPAPEDVLQWLIYRCAKAGPGQLDANKISERLLILNLVSIYTTTYAFANAMLDIYAAASKDDFVAGLRAECEYISGRYNGLSTKQAIDKLYRIDSAIRESLRTSAFGTICLLRIVAPGTRLDLGNGIHIPERVRLGVPCQAIHLDESAYTDALEFDAFRFSRPFEGTRGPEPSSTTGQRLSVDLDASFLTYGFGKHACPGRDFASQMMKQALAHVILNYDVECIGGRPKKQELLNMVLPPTSAHVRIRRRL